MLRILLLPIPIRGALPARPEGFRVVIPAAPIDSAFRRRRAEHQLRAVYDQADNYAEYDGMRANGEDACKAVSGTKTKGFEAEISGEIMTGWQLLAGYTYARPRDKDGKRISSNHPEQLFKLATHYQLTGDREYLSGYGLYSTYFYGDPRNLMVGMKYRF